MTRSNARGISWVALGACVAIAGCSAGASPEGRGRSRGTGDAGVRATGDGATAFTTDDAALASTGVDGGPRPSGSEACGDGLDGDLDGTIDETCSCTPDDMQPCFAGDPALAGVGACELGEQVCDVSGEFGGWGECAGSGSPSAEICNRVDDDCDGTTDEGLGVAAADEFDLCGDRIDGDCDGTVDEDCTTCIDGGAGASGAPWQQFIDRRLVCFGDDLDRDRREFDFARIPAATSTSWDPRAVATIDFDDPSSIPDDFCDGGHTGGVFSYFQTFVDVPMGVTITRMTITMTGTDDAVQIKIYNSRYPTGHTEAAWHAFDGGGTFDLTRFAVRGENRIVLTHLDDNPSSRTLRGVRIDLNGAAIADCR